DPACMPDHGLCDATHPCCSGVACTGGLCGGACAMVGSPCDAGRPCCPDGTCAGGVCSSTLGCQPIGTPCSDSQPCCGGFCEPATATGTEGFCRPPNCAVGPRACGFLSSEINGCCGLTDVGGCCIEVIGCYLSEHQCTSNDQCCSGVCAL